jgi:hypothetical protein
VGELLLVEPVGTVYYMDRFVPLDFGIIASTAFIWLQDSRAEDRLPMLSI